MKELIKSIEPLVQEELERAKAKFPDYHSAHEGYALMKEEIEECQDALNIVKNLLEQAWTLIKSNANPKQQILIIQEFTKKTAAEAIQISVTAHRTEDMLEREETK